MHFGVQSSRRRESSPSFPRKRESSGPIIGLIVLAQATSPMRANTLGPCIPASTGMTEHHPFKCGIPSMEAARTGVRQAGMVKLLILEIDTPAAVPISQPEQEPEHGRPAGTVLGFPRLRAAGPVDRAHRCRVPGPRPADATGRRRRPPRGRKRPDDCRHRTDLQRRCPVR